MTRTLPTFAAALLLVATAGTAFEAATLSAAATSVARYVDCRTGNDAAPGTIEQPWATLKKASAATLAAGDQLLLARGCVWDGQHLELRWAGSPDAPIVIAGYGAGERPMIRNGGFANVIVTGSYIVIDGLVSANDPRQLTACGQPIGTYYGFTFTNGAHDTTLTNSLSTGSTAGVHLGVSSRAIHVIANEIRGNNVMESFGTGNDLGAWGVNVHSDDNEIAFNRFTDNAAVCDNPSTPHDSNSLEIFEASNNNIHDNVSVNDRVFTELGSSAKKKSTGNVFAGNVFQTDRPDSRFIVTRGGKDGVYGPVLGTNVVNNTTFQTGPGSQSIVCDRGCAIDVLSVSANIFWAEQKAIYADQPFALGQNVVWNSSGSPFVQVPGDLTSLILAKDPGFADPGASDFTPTRTPGFGASGAGHPAAEPPADPAPPSPLRILDTRTGDKPGPGSVLTVQVAGRAGVPTSGVAAVVINLVMTEASGAGFVTVWPSGQPMPLASSLNAAGPGATIANLVTVPVGPDGSIQIFTQSGGHLVADVAGWLPSGAFVALSPARILDTRPGPQQLAYAAGMPEAGSTIDLQVLGREGVPKSGVSAVVLTVTVTGAEDSGYITVWPAGADRPLASALNTVGGGGTSSNQVTVATGTDGKVSIYSQSSTHVIVDVAGYYVADGAFHALAPTRIFDTRSGQLGGTGSKPPADHTLSVRVAGAGPVPATGVRMVVLNVTATEASGAGYVSVWPGGEERKLTSALNLTTVGQTRSNAVLVPVGADGTIQLYTQSGTHLIVDVTGWLSG